MAAAVDISTLISKRPEMHGGKPCIAGTGVTVLTMVELFEAGLDPRQIQGQYPHVALEGILAALAYATANREEIDDWFRLDQEAHDELFGTPTK
jgi:uncharacterized protein (DUF433 family)